MIFYLLTKIEGRPHSPQDSPEAILYIFIAFVRYQESENNNLHKFLKFNED